MRNSNLLAVPAHARRIRLLAAISKPPIIALVIALITSGTAIAQPHPSIAGPTLTLQNSGTRNGLIGVSAVSAQVVWACGKNGTFTRTINGGETWKAGVVAGAETLQFRDVHGVSDQVAYLLSVGDHPADFRIYKTIDGGASWTIEFQNASTKAFYDCFAFWTPTRGIAHSDSVAGVFPDLRTTNGTTWRDISGKLPAALPGEGSFASSGTCIATQGQQNAWIATGGASVSRVLVTRNGGERWTAYQTPLQSSQGAGAFTVAFRDARNGIVGGGNLDPKHPNDAAAATSHDGGKTWALTNKPPVTGPIYGLSYVGGVHSRVVVITANDGGAAWTPDEGVTWSKLSAVSGYWGVEFAGPEAGWLVGTDGRILKISF